MKAISKSFLTLVAITTIATTACQSQQAQPAPVNPDPAKTQPTNPSNQAPTTPNNGTKPSDCKSNKVVNLQPMKDIQAAAKEGRHTGFNDTVIAKPDTKLKLGDSRSTVEKELGKPIAELSSETYSEYIGGLRLVYDKNKLISIYREATFFGVNTKEDVIKVFGKPKYTNSDEGQESISYEIGKYRLSFEFRAVGQYGPQDPELRAYNIGYK